MTVEAPEIERQPITDRQREIYEWIVDFCGTRGYSPTIRELCAAFGFSSPNAAVQHLAKLRAGGWVTWIERSQRTLRPVGGTR